MKKDLIDIARPLPVRRSTNLIATAQDIIAHPEAYREKCKYKKLATLFFEPSTRTRLSFEAAMYELGGSVIGFSDASVQLRLQGRERRGYSPDGVLLCRYHRHAALERGRALCCRAECHRCPVINAGDGGHNHPTQTLTDLLTITPREGAAWTT